MGLPIVFNLTSEMEVHLRGRNARMTVYPETDEESREDEEPEQGLPTGGA